MSILNKIIALMLPLLLLTMSFAGCLEDDDDDDEEEEDVPEIEYPFEEVLEFHTIDLKTNETYNTSWAIYRRAEGGNCCEHYLAATHNGWITNLGGEYPTWSEDRGENWSQYIPPTQPVDYLGEGAITETPTGDIIANSWYPYTGDKLYSYFWDADTQQWSWADNQLHEPFYDRAWQVVVPGPIFFEGDSFPWASYIVSNFWRSAGNGYVLSLDGLIYTEYPDPTPAMDTVEFDIDVTPDEMWDYIIPHREMRATPLLIQGGLLFPNYFGNGESAYMDTNLIWHRHTMPAGKTIPSEYLIIDSTGAMHSIEQQGATLIYHLSLDGGENWNSTNLTYPLTGGGTIEEWEFHAMGSRELMVVNMRVEVQENDETVDKDLIFHIRDYRESIEPDTLTFIGLGDADFTSGAGNEYRFDFASLAIMPDGGAVVSYQDSTDIDPLFAMELEMPYDDNPFNDLE